MISSIASADLLMRHAQVGFLRFIVSRKFQVISFQATICYGNNTKAVNGPVIILSAPHSPNWDITKSGAPARKMKKIFYSNDAAFIKTNSQ